MHENDDINEIIQDEELTRQYLKAVDLETPDLWDRIEAGISETSKVVSFNKDTDSMDTQTQKNLYQGTEQGKAQREKKLHKRKPYMKLLAAAAALLILVVPAWMMLGGNRSKEEDKMNGLNSMEETAPVPDGEMDGSLAETAPNPYSGEQGTEEHEIEDAADEESAVDYADQAESAAMPEAEQLEIPLKGTLKYLDGEYYIQDYTVDFVRMQQNDGSSAVNADTESVVSNLKERLYIMNPHKLPSQLQSMEDGEEYAAEFIVTVVQPDDVSDKAATEIEIVSITLPE